MSANQHLVEVFTRHQIFLQRYGGRVTNEVLPLFDSMLIQINALLAEQPTAFTTQRLVVLGNAIEEIVSDTAQEMTQLAIPELEDLAVYESGFTQRALSQVLDVDVILPTPEQVLGAVSDDPATLVGGTVKRPNVTIATIAQMFEDFTDKKPGEISRIVQSGFIQGQTTQEITREVTRVVNTRTKPQAETIVRTATNHAAAMGRLQTYRDNSDVIKDEEWFSTLDDRTSLTCTGLDGRIFPIGEGPYPPQHFNCRSVRIARVKDEFALPGFTGERASVQGPQSSATTYNSFLKRQSKAFQDEVLGPDRAKLFRDGGLNVRKFTDDDGIVYTLDQLRELEPLAFERAGVE